MGSCVIFGLLYCLLLFVGSQGAKLCPRVKTRMQWGADEPRSSFDLESKPSQVLVKEAGESCSNRALCSSEVKTLQAHDMLAGEFPDIFCNFIIGGDGQVYTGTGWSKGTFSMTGISICMLGHFDTAAPVDLQSDTLKTFLTCSFEEDKLSSNYEVKAWSDSFSFYKGKNPGSFLYKVIQDLPQYAGPPTTE